MSELFNFIEDMANPTLKRENLKEGGVGKRLVRCIGCSEEVPESRTRRVIVDKDGSVGALCDICHDKIDGEEIRFHEDY
jgi:hypothetical protein